MLRRLRVFHARCVRAMCRVSRKHTWEHHISTAQLERRLGLDPIDIYISRRQLRWLGHVRRMDYERLPRRMLSSWVACTRPRGAPPMTYGRSIGRALDDFHIDRRTWMDLAADRSAWRETLRVGHPPGYVEATWRRRRRRHSLSARDRPAVPPSPRVAALSGHCVRCARRSMPLTLLSSSHRVKSQGRK